MSVLKTNLLVVVSENLKLKEAMRSKGTIIFRKNFSKVALMQLFKISQRAENGRATVQSAEVFGGTVTLELKLCLH